MAQLKRMVDGANRTWIGRAEPPQQFADGTRLFAYRALRPKLSCRELSLALTEIDTSQQAAARSGFGRRPDRARTRGRAGQRCCRRAHERAREPLRVGHRHPHLGRRRRPARSQ